jgi:DNA-binding MarR family transcriptional regulator
MKYDNLKIKNQLCHPLYSAANAIVRAYEPHLKKLDLTYAQYLVMMVLWEEDKVSISKISEETFIDSGSMTPILKRLADKKLITINVSKEDLRQKVIGLTRKGSNLKDEALEILPELANCFTSITMDEAMMLKKILNKLFANLVEDAS